MILSHAMGETNVTAGSAPAAVPASRSRTPRPGKPETAGTGGNPGTSGTGVTLEQVATTISAMVTAFQGQARAMDSQYEATTERLQRAVTEIHNGREQVNALQREVATLQRDAGEAAQHLADELATIRKVAEHADQLAHGTHQDLAGKLDAVLDGIAQALAGLGTVMGWRAELEPLVTKALAWSRLGDRIRGGARGARRPAPAAPAAPPRPPDGTP